MRGSLKAYKSVALDSQKTVASPYKVVQMLLAGVLERLAKARVAAEQQQPAVRGEQISSALAIIVQLRDAVDLEAGGDIAGNLDRLYEFALTELLQANSENNAERIEQVSGLIRGIKESWDAIPVGQQDLPVEA